jgi:insulysin
LDRFSQFFTAPLFSPSCVERELNAVHNENAKNLQVDTWRLYQLLKSTSSPSHPFAKFGTGNHATLRDGPKELGIDVRSELLKFHREKYSSHLMRLCVIGRESLDDLETLVASKFSGIPRVDTERPKFGNQAMTSSELGRMIRVVPVKDTRTLQLLWHFDTPVQHLYGTKPLELLSHCLGHESCTPARTSCQCLSRMMSPRVPTGL